MRWLLCVVAVAGCSSGATEAVITVATEGLSAPADFDRVDILVKGPSGEISRTQVRPCIAGETPSPGGCVRVPFTVLLVPGSERPKDSVTIEVIARLQASPVARTEITLMFSERSTVRLTLLLRQGVLDGGVVDQALPDDTGPLADLLGLDLIGVDASTPADMKIVRRVFLAKPHAGGLSMRNGANVLCNMDAQQAGLGGNFAAVLGDHINSASSQITLNDPNRPIVLVDGTLVTRDQDFFGDAPHFADINMKADGSKVMTNANVWTGFTKYGLSHGGMADPYCFDWNSPGVANMGYVGKVNGGRTDGTWADAGTSVGCSNLLSFYCIEQ
jgi:hypothetical protein